MLDKIIGFVKEKMFRPTSSLQQKVAQESEPHSQIDYDLLANKVAEKCNEELFGQLEEKLINAQVAAHFKIKEIEAKQELDKQKEEQARWEKALHYAPYKGKCPFLRLLYWVFFPWISLWGFARFSKEDAQTEFGMYGFMRMLGCRSLKTYETAFCLLGLFFVVFCAYLNINAAMVNWFWTIVLVFISWILLLIAACVRIFRLKLDCSTNKNTIIVATTLIMTINTIVLSAVFAIIGPYIGTFLTKILGGM